MSSKSNFVEVNGRSVRSDHQSVSPNEPIVNPHEADIAAERVARGRAGNATVVDTPPVRVAAVKAVKSVKSKATSKD